MRILVADDQSEVRKRICTTLSKRADFEVCAEAIDGHDAVEKAKELKPDVIILDITMPRVNGLEAARKIRAFDPVTPILILSVHKSKQLLEEARKIGVQGYVTKEDVMQSLLHAMDALSQKQTFFPPDL